MKKQRVEISLLAQKDLHSFERFANYSPDATRFTDRMLQRVRLLEHFKN